MVSRRVIVLLVIGLCAPARAEDELDNAMGKAIFERLWVGAPASTASADGLGPLFDARACASCHKDAGAGATALEDGAPLAGSGFILRLGNARAGAADPVYGTQIQLRSLQGHSAEADAAVHWDSVGGLRKPRLALSALGYGPLAPGTAVSLRRAPSLKDAALIAHIPQADILAREDADDANHDGVSGRANWVSDGHGGRALGRFGWKAGEPTLAAQTARAFSRDMGLSSALLPAPWGDCTPAQAACRAAPHGGTPDEPEVKPALAALILAYLGGLTPPARPANPAGEAAFGKARCGACHAGPALSDLLLHDMGEGLADGVSEGMSTPGEWRTAPLTDVAQSLARGGLLHDGRARSVREAVLWHDGEAAPARARQPQLGGAERAALGAYVTGETP